MEEGTVRVLQKEMDHSMDVEGELLGERPMQLYLTVQHEEHQSGAFVSASALVNTRQGNKTQESHISKNNDRHVRDCKYLQEKLDNKDVKMDSLHSHLLEIKFDHRARNDLVVKTVGYNIDY